MATLVAPAGDGGVLLQPTWPWPGLAETARDLIARWPAHVRAMREPARLEICGNARGAERASWVVTGHQPIVVHPGIWFRFAVLHELTRCGAHGLEVVVDTDEASPIQIRLPSIDPTPRVTVLGLVDLEDGRVFANVRITRELRGVRDRGREALRSFGDETVSRFDAFMDTLARHLTTEMVPSHVLPAVRRHLEGNAAYSTTTVSHVASSASHHAFVVDIVERAELFATSTNEALVAYRRAHGIRNRAQPMPDLSVEDDRIELPFWSLRKQRRWRAWRHGATLRDEAGASLGLAGQSLSLALQRGDWTLWPRAITLTLYQRLRIADVFIHGLGSARYDAASDHVAAAMWGVTLPEAPVATATRLLAVPNDRTAEQAVKDLADLRSHPERVAVTYGGATGAALATEKARLIAALGTAPSPDLHRKLRAIGSELRELVSDRVAEWTAAATRAAVADKLRHDRELAYFLWPFDELRELLR